MAEIGSIEYVSICDLRSYENNSKTHSDKQIKLLQKSILEFGFLSPCLIDENNNIIAGHGRTMAAEMLGLDKVPCVRCEGLTDDQRKAYIIADNKLTEIGGWDKELVAAELSLLDLNGFGIDITGFSIKDVNDIQLKPIKPYGAERDRTVKAYNLDKMNRVDLQNDYWQMPVIESCDYIPKDLIGFNYAKTNKDKDVGVHFFIDDYQFERIWNDPEKYVEILSEYDCVLSPEFSLYWDMPLPMKIWNTYRNRFIGSYLQRFGIKVIPTICWAGEDTFDFCFCGIEYGSIVAVETNGTKSGEAFKRWCAGMDELIKRINPKTILLYGGRNQYDFKDTEVIYFENKVLRNWKDDNV